MSAFAGEKASRNDDWTKEDSDASIGGEEGDAGESEDDESEDEEDDDGKLDDDVKKEEAKGKIGIQQPLSKKEKAALKAKELEDLDDIFSEFGIDIKKSGDGNGKEVDDSAKKGAQADADGTNATSDKKKKKKKKPKKKPEEDTAAPALSKEEARAKLAKKVASKSKDKVSDAAAAIKADSEGTKKVSKSVRKKTLPEWDR